MRFSTMRSAYARHDKDESHLASIADILANEYEFIYLCETMLHLCRKKSPSDLRSLDDFNLSAVLPHGFSECLHLFLTPKHPRNFSLFADFAAQLRIGLGFLLQALIAG